MRESGLTTKWINDIIEYNRNKIGNTVFSDKPKLICDYNDLNIDNVFDLFYCLIIGIVCSIILHIYELFHNTALFALSRAIHFLQNNT